MAVYIKNFEIEGFRGINRLRVDGLNHVNIIAGDNNSGKTSVLEALLLLKNPKDFANVLKVARIRERQNFPVGISAFESFINLFPKTQYIMEIGLKAIHIDESVSFKLVGEKKEILYDFEEDLKGLDPVKRRRIEKGTEPSISEVDAFIGELICKIGDREEKHLIDMNAYSSISGRIVDKADYLKMEYLSPTQHLQGSIINRIISDDSYKEICLHILQILDPDIIDLLILRNEDNNRPVEYIKHSKLGNMPISTYGDGIKKILLLANGVAKSTGGVLLIDEMETAIHSKYFENISAFLIKAAIGLNVQIFITTHNLEAIDSLLATQNYGEQSQKDEISVLTFKKDFVTGKTLSRVLSGRDVYKNRENFDFEVRL